MLVSSVVGLLDYYGNPKHQHYKPMPFQMKQNIVFHGNNNNTTLTEN